MKMHFFLDKLVYILDKKYAKSMVIETNNVSTGF